MSLKQAILHAEILLKGGAGSGNFGHAGRPGEVGGSGGGGGGGSQGKAKEMSGKTLVASSNAESVVNATYLHASDRSKQAFAASKMADRYTQKHGYDSKAESLHFKAGQAHDLAALITLHEGSQAAHTKAAKVHFKLTGRYAND
jgi:hypothetical protein